MSKLYRYLKIIVKQHLKKLLLIVFFLTISTLLNIVMPIINKKIIDDGLLKQDVEKVIVYSVTLFIVFFLHSIIRIVNENIRIGIEKQLRRDLGNVAFKHLINLRINYYENKNYSELFYNVNTDINRIVGLIDSAVLIAITQLLSLIGGFIGLYLIGRELIILILIFIPAKYLCVKYFAENKEKIVHSCICYDSEYAKWFGNVIGGIKEIKLFSIKQKIIRDYEMHQLKILDSNGKIQNLDEIDSAINNIFSQMILVIIYIIGTILTLKKGYSIGSIISFLNYSIIVINPIFLLLNIRYSMSCIRPSIDRFEDFMKWEEENNIGELNKFSIGDIEFRGITFGYEDSNNIFDNLYLKIDEKDKVVIVGANGSGKTTLIELLLRLYKPKDGEILIGNLNIQDYSLEEYRKQFAVVSQNVYLFNASIEENIKMGKEIENSKIFDILNLCGLEIFANEKGIKQIVGEKGELLSGGEKQKISLVRALICDCPIIILDEPTANMDIDSYSRFQNLMLQRLKDKTVIGISHENALIEMFDKVIYI